MVSIFYGNAYQPLLYTLLIDWMIQFMIGLFPFLCNPEV